MRNLVLFPLLLVATPALAQTPAPASPAPASPQAQAEIQRQLNNPAMADRLANMIQALSRAFLDLPIGEVQAAAEGRKATAAERRLKVRDMGRRDDPNFERNFQRQVANSKPMIEASMRALSQALPVMMQSIEQAGHALERAASNMPDPTYPKR